MSAIFNSLTAARLESAVATLGQPHAAHPTVTDTGDQPVRAECLASQGHRRGAAAAPRVPENATLAGLRALEQRLKVSGKGRVSE
jgi:hypothetical protein